MQRPTGDTIELFDPGTGPRSLTDLAIHQYNIRLRCRLCRHARVLDGINLWWHFERRGWRDGFSAIGTKLHCSQCLIRLRRRILDPAIEVTRDPPQGVQLPDCPEAEWKRMRKRHRT